MFCGWERTCEEMPCDPHATTPPAAATSAAVARRRRMTGAIIRKAMTGGRATALLVAPAAVVAAGCGSHVAYTRAPARHVQVALDEFRVVPERIEVRAGRVT